MLTALDAGAEDIIDEGELWKITSAPSDVNAVRDAFDGAAIAVESADVVMLPTSTVEMTEVGDVKKLLTLMELLDDLDDVQDVHGNMDASDAVLEQAQAE